MTTKFVCAPRLRQAVQLALGANKNSVEAHQVDPSHSLDASDVTERLSPFLAELSGCATDQAPVLSLLAIDAVYVTLKRRVHGEDVQAFLVKENMDALHEVGRRDIYLHEMLAGSSVVQERTSTSSVSTDAVTSSRRQKTLEKAQMRLEHMQYSDMVQNLPGVTPLAAAHLGDQRAKGFGADLRDMSVGLDVWVILLSMFAVGYFASKPIVPSPEWQWVAGLVAGVGGILLEAVLLTLRGFDEDHASQLQSLAAK